MKKVLVVLLLFVIGILCGGYFSQKEKFPVLTGYAAKKACSNHFITDQNLASIKSFDLAKSPLNLASIEINEKEKSVEASVFGLGKSKAIYTKNMGCQLIHAEDHKAIKADVSLSNENIENGYTLPQNLTKLSKEKINNIVDLAFDKEDEWLKQTRALVIIQNDSLIAEHYAPGFDKDTEQLGWSMTKSLCNALVGILVKEGKLHLNKTALFEEWLDDKRRNISLTHLLQMTPGLVWDENYAKISPATQMLFTKENMGDYAAMYKSEFEPGSHWEYSSGTTNIIGKLIRDQFDSHEAYLEFPYKSLLHKIGIKSFVLEPDASGHYVFSSYCYGTPRDWGKLGLLYLNDGIVNGDTILSKDWVEYSTTPVGASPNGKYGAQIWLNTNKSMLPDLPANAYSFNGFEGQYVYVFPDKNAVVVRMGLSKGPPFDLNAVMKKIYDAL